MRTTTVSLFLLLAFSVSSPLLRADAVGASYTVSGTAGDWTLDFSVTNNISPGQNMYFFGVHLPAHDITNSPGAFVDWSCAYVGNCSATYNIAVDGGPDLVLNNSWIDTVFQGITYGSTLSGFEVLDTSQAAPTSVQWAAFSAGSPYLGSDCFDCSNPNNPGFTGTAAVPEPASLPLLSSSAIGFAGILGKRFAGMLRKRKGSRSVVPPGSAGLRPRVRTVSSLP